MSIIKYTEFIKEGYETKNEDGKDKKFRKIHDDGTEDTNKYGFWGVGLKYGKLLTKLASLEVGGELKNKEGGYKIKRIK